LAAAAARAAPRTLGRGAVLATAATSPRRRLLAAGTGQASAPPPWLFDREQVSKRFLVKDWGLYDPLTGLGSAHRSFHGACWLQGRISPPPGKASELPHALRHSSTPIYGTEQQRQGSPRGVCFLPVSLKMVPNSSAPEPHGGTVAKGDEGSVSQRRDSAVLSAFGHSQQTPENAGELYPTKAGSARCSQLSSKGILFPPRAPQHPKPYSLKPVPRLARFG